MSGPEFDGDWMYCAHRGCWERVALDQDSTLCPACDEGELPDVSDHLITQERDGGQTRWACACGWATPWTFYTDPGAAPSAIRHQINPEETQ